LLLGGARPFGAKLSKVFLQVHACIKLPHLRFVAVKHQCFALFGEQAVFADAALCGLAPAGLKTWFVIISSNRSNSVTTSAI
jgi:hypothetical protein